MSIVPRAAGLAVVLVAVLVGTASSSCTKAVTFKDDEFRFPADFKGVALVLWNEPGGQRLERVSDNGRRFTFPADGVLRLQDAQPPGSRWVKDHPPRFLGVATDGTTTPLASFWAPQPGAPEAELGSTFARPGSAGRPCAGESLLVGFRTDAEKEAMRKEFPGRVEAACAAQ